MAKARILVVEDEISIADTLLYAMRTDGLDCVHVSTGQAATEQLRAESYDLIVLDVGLPDANGFELCRSWRRELQTPILFLTARSEEIDRIVGLELGADDYVTKPFSPRELSARVRAILRRTQNGAAPRPPPPSEWAIDPCSLRVLHQGHPLHLTRNEFRLFQALFASPGRVFSRDQLLAAAWPDPGACSDRTVDAHVKSLRAKLRELPGAPDPIETRRGLGYAFDAHLKT